MNLQTRAPVTANGRAYPWPKGPAVAICLDGCEPAYLDVAIAEGLMPTLKRMREAGTDRIAHSVIPSFTNPNNLSIATGRPPAVHGICGNYLYEPETGQEVMMNDVRFLRAPTVFAKFYEAGARVAVVTAKDKLRALLGAGLRFDEDRAIAFSSEKSGTTTKAEHGIANASRWLLQTRRELMALVRRRGAAMTIVTAASHLSLYLVLLTALRCVGVSEDQLSWEKVLAGFALVRLLSALPITPGGVGVVVLQGLTPRSVVVVEITGRCFSGLAVGVSGTSAGIKFDQSLKDEDPLLA